MIELREDILLIADPFLKDINFMRTVVYMCRHSEDGSFGFDFGGIYDEVIHHKKISYTMGDGRTVNILFSGDEIQTHITETFDPEDHHPLDMQQAGWQAILDNFKKYVEAN